MSRINSEAADALEARLTMDEGEEKPLLFFGAGLTAHRFGTWKVLIDELSEELGVELPDNGENLIEKAQRLFDAGSEAYVSALKNRFSSIPSIDDCSEALKLLYKLRFHAFLTTNYDKSLESVHRDFYREGGEACTYPHISYGDIEEGRLFYIHGTVKPTDVESVDIVLHKTSYEAAYNREPSPSRRLGPLTEFWRSVFKKEKLVIVGVGINEEEPFLKVLEDLRRFGFLKYPEAGCSCQHVMLTPSLAVKSGGEERSDEHEAFMRSHYRSNFGLDLLFYDKIDGTHEGLRRILDHVKRKMDSKTLPFKYDTGLNQFDGYVG